jgi:RNA polymerase sigma factor (sigma-70 family)
MAAAPFKAVIHYLRQCVGWPHAAGTTDGELLERFARQGDQRAFEALMQQHGPMVWGLCRRLLDDPQDAEDAFQATFLVLVRKAGALRQPELLANWLYGVACRTARRARADASRRRLHERETAKMPALEPTDDATWQELRPVLDEELERLPVKYRAPLVLCYLEGKTYVEAAAILGWSRGTVSGRLVRARELLKGRLERRGVALDGAVLGTALSGSAPAAPVPTALCRSTLEAAAAGAISARVDALTQGVLHAIGSRA